MKQVCWFKKFVNCFNGNRKDKVEYEKATKIEQEKREFFVLRKMYYDGILSTNNYEKKQYDRMKYLGKKYDLHFKSRKGKN